MLTNIELLSALLKAYAVTWFLSPLMSFSSKWINKRMMLMVKHTKLHPLKRKTFGS